MIEKKYSWQGINQQGSRVSGDTLAIDIATLKKELSQKNIFPLKIHEKSKLFSSNKNKKISTKNIADFSRQLATLINAGVPLLTTINIIQQSTEQKNMHTLLTNFKKDLEKGNTLSFTFRRYFDELFCNLIYAGEQSGTLHNILNHLANHKEKIENLKSKIKKALFYPCMVFVTTIIITIVLLLFVVPQFAQLFHGFGAELPLYTQFILNLSVALKNYGIFILIIIIISIITFKQISKRSPAISNLVAAIVLTMPGIGILLKKAIITRFTYTLALTFNAGLPLSEALLLAANTCGNRIYKQAIINIHKQVTQGQTISSSLQDNLLFPNRVKQMIHIGEESGSLGLMLMKIAEYYETEVNYIIENINNLLEPTIMIILGILIGGLIIGLYLPIFKLGTVL